MGSYIEIGDYKITEENVFSILAQKQIVIPLATEIILDSAIAHIECSPEEKNMAYQQFFNQMKIAPNDKQQLKAWLERNYLTPEDLENRVLRGIKLDKFKEKTFGPQLESYYLRRKRELDRVIYSLIRTTNVGQAQELFFRIQDDGQDFATLAREFSQGSEAKTGGVVGPVELTVPHPQIAQLLMTAQQGKVLAPVRIGEWVVILRLERYIPAQLDMNTARRLMEELFNNWLNKEIQNQVKFHLENFTISLPDDDTSPPSMNGHSQNNQVIPHTPST
ncbi:peptidylprolyl isomerase [Cyanobacterium stanieri LEGE 03274]|uniref:peptidylprolyl isomerase n=1 Tax=Cyanobacterium stanieri LEGE 03274 TaxID=1828756 RepID=A0ABR9V4R2_9CHRO|nr:peptidylprolyl isomerase [Cyanobacterium stanieri]MBE9222141.1 peptidylprolyl isomerase [Cyanobacterium stanieri LEGE 03274]